ncbi:MAG: DUF3795 domain-containing protein [Desulfobacter sp.]|nr:DUF3795 domain-containing protein [Desulfobacter sp.]WDP84157.1 MAG: DUF3795 domain-containing protein [Desulfobacter sp.]
MSEMIAFCGLNCTQCPSFLATLNDDDRAREQTAAFYAKKFGMTVKPEDVNCDGCKSDSGRLFAYCRSCKIRQCSMDKKLDNCASCREQPCDKLQAFHLFAPEAKAFFDRLLEEKR